MRFLALSAPVMRCVLAVSLGAGLGACGGASETGPASGDGADPEVPQPPDDLPETAKVSVWRAMVEDARAVRHPSDGGGTVTWVDRPDEPLVAGTPGSFRLRYEAGPHGVAEGGSVTLQVPAFWEWSTPQTLQPAMVGYTEVSTAAEGVGLEVDQPDGTMVRATIRGRALAPGETILFHYGAGDLGAVVDAYAEEGERLDVGVDGDGDGVRGMVADPPTVDVVAGPPAGLVVTLPITARPGEPVRLTVAGLDAHGNLSRLQGPVRLISRQGWSLPADVVPDPTHGTVSLEVPAPPAGVHRVGATVGERLVGLSDPMVVHPDAPVVQWADLQVHTAMSDGSGDLDGVYRYARDAAGLDAVAITDHDHWGMPFLDATPALWEAQQAAAARWHEPGRFVTFPAFEWTSWLFGHRHVLYVGETVGSVVSSIAEGTDEPRELWDALQGHDALTIPHHTAGGPVPIDWRVPPDPRFEPVAEVCSVHGSSESADTPQRIRGYVEGHGVRSALDRGYRLGMLCSTDGHDGHPGLAHLRAGSGGLAAVVTEDRTRAGLAAAIRARHVYGTNGVRMLLRVKVGAAEMGDVVALPAEGTAELEVRVVAGDPVAAVDLVVDGEVVARRAPGTSAARETFALSELVEGSYAYVRVVTERGGAAWSSPVWFSAEASPVE